jgi:hypothetical protein
MNKSLLALIIAIVVILEQLISQTTIKTVLLFIIYL